VHSLDGLPKVTREPLYFNESKKLLSWARDIGHSLGKNKSTVDSAFYSALTAQKEDTHFTNQHSFPIKILLLGHRYTIEDPYLNMDLIKRLNAHNIGMITSGAVSEKQQNEQLQHFTKKPFWYDFRQAYSSAAYLTQHQQIDGIIYLTSFGCGMDAIIIEVIKEDIHQLPLLVVKLDEHTGDAGLDTRLEAFSDMLERRLS
ncbi:MAG: 2-hydroxyglutaryl-CoA dehydratase, partial [Vallitaleaceae bacterium]|nr:2-hydroxyglutaryl-CoA dehydratase [Vallitaleaceae bacterium]